MKTISKLLYALKNKNIFFYYQKLTITFVEYLEFKLEINQNDIQEIICIEFHPKFYWLNYKNENRIF